MLRNSCIYKSIGVATHGIKLSRKILRKTKNDILCNIYRQGNNLLGLNWIFQKVFCDVFVLGKLIMRGVVMQRKRITKFLIMSLFVRSAFSGIIDGSVAPYNESWWYYGKWS